MVSSVRHLCHIFDSLSTNVGFFIGCFGPHLYIHSISCFSHSLFSGPKQLTSSGFSLSVLWGGNFRIVMSSSNAVSINVVDICVQCPSNRRSSLFKFQFKLLGLRKKTKKHCSSFHETYLKACVMENSIILSGYVTDADGMRIHCKRWNKYTIAYIYLINY